MPNSLCMRALLTITVMLAFTKISTVIKGFIPKYRFVRHGYYHPAVRGQQYIDSYSTLFLSARASRVKLSTPGSSLVRLHATKTNLGDDNSIDNERNRFGLSNEYDYNDPSLGGSGPAGSPSESAGPAAYTVRNNRRSEKFNELIKDLRDLISTPGMTRVGVTRSVQVARAFARITLDYSRNRAAFTNPTTKRLSAPKAMRRLFEELGATYIKLGQFIASSPTLFPAEYVSEFQACLDKSPTVPYSEVKKIIEQDLGRPIALMFERINPIPIASASIAQVHRAILKNGTEVAVKVRKPGVDSTLKADLGFLLVTSRIIEFINPSLTAFSLSNIVSDIRESMLDELDFTKEAANLVNFREFLDRRGINDATAPAPYPEASGKRVLTMEYLSGVPLVDLENIKKYSDSPEETLVSALRTWALTVATNDVFHADVHAGNVLVLEDGRVGFIDFGIVGRISNSFRDAIGSMFEAFVQDDFSGVARALVQMGATDSGVDIAKFGADLQAVVDRITRLRPEITIESDEFGQAVDARLDIDERETTQLVLEIVTVAENNGLKLPREFGLVLKQALYFDRYQKLLAPSMDPIRDARLRESFNDQILKPPGGGGSAGSSKRRNFKGGVSSRSNDPTIIDVEIISDDK